VVNVGAVAVPIFVNVPSDPSAIIARAAVASSMRHSPSWGRTRSAWKRRMAASVRLPKSPSTPPGSNAKTVRNCWTWRTASPSSPFTSGPSGTTMVELTAQEIDVEPKMSNDAPLRTACIDLYVNPPHSTPAPWEIRPTVPAPSSAVMRTLTAGLPIVPLVVPP
jgi:hypothetical protein